MAAIDQQPAFGAAHLDGGAGDAWRERRFERRREFGRIFQQHVDRVGRGAAVLIVVDAARRAAADRDCPGP